MHQGKRGQHSNMELWFLVAAFVLAAVAGIDLMKDTSQRIGGTLLEKNYIARDLSMAIEAIYASPGNIDFVYGLGSYRYGIDVVGGKVSVKDGKGEASYRIIGVDEKSGRYVSFDNPEGLKVGMPDFVTAKVLSFKECGRPASLLLSKRFNEDGSSEISVSGKNAILICEKAGENADEGCVKRVVPCE